MAPEVVHMVMVGAARVEDALVGMGAEGAEVRTAEEAETGQEEAVMAAEEAETGQEEVVVWQLYFGYDDDAARTVDHILQYMRPLPNWAYNGGAVAGDGLPESLVQLRRGHLVGVDRAVLGLVELTAVSALGHLEAKEAVLVARHGN